MPQSEKCSFMTSCSRQESDAPSCHEGLKVLSNLGDSQGSTSFRTKLQSPTIKSCTPYFLKGCGYPDFFAEARQTMKLTPLRAIFYTMKMLYGEIMQHIAQCGFQSSGHKAAPLDKLCHTILLLKTRHVILQGKEQRPNGLLQSKRSFRSGQVQRSPLAYRDKTHLLGEKCPLSAVARSCSTL
jgi:hypothetical protein